MKQVYIIHENNPQLLLFFAGWACDETPFKQYRPQSMDHMVCYDYRSLDFDRSLLDRYETVNVIGWSMGVWVASLVLGPAAASNVVSIAFNGSPLPINDSLGIPHHIYQATLDGLTPASLQKFMRRMCSGSQAYKAFMDITPRRDFNEIKDELACIQQTYLQMYEGSSYSDNGKSVPNGQADESETVAAYLKRYGHPFDYVYIGTQDRIFPPANLQQAFGFAKGSRTILADCAHYDEAMFRFLLQDQWEMPFNKHLLHLRQVEQKALQDND